MAGELWQRKHLAQKRSSASHFHCFLITITHHRDDDAAMPAPTPPPAMAMAPSIAVAIVHPHHCRGHCPPSPSHRLLLQWPLSAASIAVRNEEVRTSYLFIYSSHSLPYSFLPLPTSSITSAAIAPLPLTTSAFVPLDGAAAAISVAAARSHRPTALMHSTMICGKHVSTSAGGPGDHTSRQPPAPSTATMSPSSILCPEDPCVMEFEDRLAIHHTNNLTIPPPLDCQCSFLPLSAPSITWQGRQRGNRGGGHL